MGIKQHRILHCFRNCWKKCEKLANKKCRSKKRLLNRSLSSSVLLTCKCFWQITFSGCSFSYDFHRFEISVKFCAFLIVICQKRKRKFLGSLCTYMSFLELVEWKFARNYSSNWKTFLTNRILLGIFLLVNSIKLWKSL